MQSSNYVFKCLPLLASVLGNKYGVKVVIQGSKAETDGNTIYIPQLPADAQSKTVALVRGYIDHEAAHVRASDFQALNDARLDHVTKWLTNAIEDWRVERKLSEAYPGCRQNMHWLAKRLFVDEQSGAGDKTSASDVLEYVLLTVRAWEVSEIEPVRQFLRKRLDAPFQGLIDKIDPVLASVRNYCPDTSSAIDYARMIAQCLKQWQPPAQNNEQKSAQGDTTESHENGNFDTSKAEDVEAKSEQKNHVPKMPSSSHNHADRQSKSVISGQNEILAECCFPQEQKPDEDVTSLFRLSPESLPASIGDILKDKITEVAEGVGVSCFHIAEECSEQLIPMSDHEQLEVRKSTGGLRSRLQGVLQATRQQRCFVGRKGSLDSGKIFRVAICNPKICKALSAKKELNTAVHIVLDASGSMEGRRMRLANQASFAIANALHHIRGITTGITAFHGFDGPKVMPMLHHGISVGQMGKASASGGTPLAAALWWVLQKMVLLKEERKIILLLSDGAPDTDDPYQDALEACKKLGVEVYGIGIQSEQIKSVIPKESRVIDKLPELTSAVFSILSKALTSEAR